MAMATVQDPSAGSQKSLMDLPVEIRQEIFALLFREDKPIRIKVIRRNERKTKRKITIRRELARRDHHRVREHRGEIYDRATDRWMAAPNITSIIYANRQLYDEGTAALYSNNAFSFNKTAILCEFLEIASDKVKYLRHIIIEGGGFGPIKIKEACDMLTAATSLRRLEIQHIDICGGIPTSRDDKIPPARKLPVQFARSCTTLLKALKASYAAQNLNSDVRDVLQIEPMPACDPSYWPRNSPHPPGRAHSRYASAGVLGYGYPCHCACSATERINDAWMEEVREEVDRILAAE